jgi:hypothetical protein
MPLRLNAYHLHFSAGQFTAFKQELPSPSDLKPLRQRLNADWFLHWRGGFAWGMPRLLSPRTSFGKPATLRTDDYESLSLLNARTSDQLSDFLPQYPELPGRGRGFRFVAKNREFVSEILKDWRNSHVLMGGFEIRPRFTCETRLIELQDQKLQSILVVGISMRWEIKASIESLADAGVDLAGLYVVRKERVPGQRNLLGQIGSIRQGTVHFLDSFDGQPTTAAKELNLEPTRRSFDRCLQHLLGRDHVTFWNQYEILQAEYLGGAGYDRCLETLAPFLTKHKGIYLGPDISVRVGDRVTFDARKPSPVMYCFDAGKTKQNQIAWAGISNAGPYDRDSFPKRTPSLLLVCPDDSQIRIEQAVRKFKDGIPNSPFAQGFVRTFHLTNLAIETCPVPAARATAQSIAAAYHGAVERQLQRRSDYDAAFVIVGDKFAELPEKSNPYLVAKAQLLTNGIPVQEARVSTLMRPDQSLAYVFQNIAVALYAKMGGVPWTVNQDQTVNDEVVIGMGLVETSGSRFEERQRVVGITTVFRGDGNYLLANVARECPFEEYRGQLRETMVDVLKEVRHRNGWRTGDSVRIVFHASKPLRDLEIDELMHDCVTEAAPDQEVQFAFIDVLQDHPFRVFDPEQQGKPAGNSMRKGAMAPARGTAIQLGKSTWLLSTNGMSQIKRPTTPLPSPLLIHLHRKSTGCDLAYLTDQVLKFTSLTWRSTQPASEPVTIYYSALIADLLTRLKLIPGWSPNVLNTKLRASKWFL